MKATIITCLAAILVFCCLSSTAQHLSTPSSVSKVKKSFSVEEAIEIYDYYAYRMSIATTDEQRAAARAIIFGVQNPLDYNDPDLDAKIQSYFEKKRPGCLATGAVCYAQFIQCLKDNNYSQSCSVDYYNCLWPCSWGS